MKTLRTWVAIARDAIFGIVFLAGLFTLIAIFNDFINGAG